MQIVDNIELDPVGSRLLADLITCALPPGSQIREASAAERYETSRTKVREALVILAGKGFVQLEKNKGAVATPIDAATVFSVFEARISAEKTAAALAAVRSSQADKETLKAYLEELRDAQAANDEDTFFAIDRSVHDAIATMSRNPFIVTQVNNMRAHTMRCWHFYRELGLTENPDFAGVNAIIKAVLAGDPKKSAGHMHTHLAKNLQEYNDMLAQQFQALNWV